MPTDLVKQLNLDLLYPPFLEKALALLATCREKGTDYVAYSGYRPFAEQDTLYKAFKAKTGGIAAPPGLSAHQYGLAMDVAFDVDKVKPGLQPGWRN